MTVDRLERRSGSIPSLLGPSIGRVAIVQVGGIGDLVHALPVANAIRDARPDLDITWITHPVPAGLLHQHRAANHVIESPRGQGIRSIAALRRRLRGERFDLALNQRVYLKSVWPTLLTGASIRVGLPRALVRDAIWLAHTHHLPGDRWKHWQDLYLDFLSFLGVHSHRVRWALTLTEEERGEQKAWFDRVADRPTVGLVVASSLRAKDWPLERQPLLVDALQETLGYRVLLVGGPSAWEREVADEISASVLGATPVDALTDSVRRLLWTIEGCDLLISPDTGPLHLAHALGVPVIGLYGRSNPWRSGPWRRFHDLLIDRYTDEGEPPDPGRTEARAGRMERISVEDVLERVGLAEEHYGVGAD